MASIGQHVNALSGEAQRLRTVFDDIQSDLAALRTAIVGITAKLDADAGVTDVNYASTLDPAANKTTA